MIATAVICKMEWIAIRDENDLSNHLPGAWLGFVCHLEKKGAGVRSKRCIAIDDDDASPTPIEMMSSAMREITQGTRDSCAAYPAVTKL